MNETNCHVQIPKFILKQFENQNHELFYYDYQKKAIKKGHAASLNTSLGFFSKEMELFLNSEVEQPFSKFLEKSKPFVMGQTVFMTPKDKNSIFVYFYSLISRGTTYLDTVKNESVTSFLFSPQELHNISVYLGITKMQTSSFFQESDVTLGINTTGIPFVLPNIGYCETKGTVIMPITPFLAVMIVYKEKERFFQNGERFFAKFNEDETVININNRLFVNEKNNKRYVTATTKKQLEEIVEKLQKEGKL